MSEITLTDMKRLVEGLSQLRKEKKAHEDEVSRVNEGIREIETQILNVLQDTGQQNFSATGVGMVSLRRIESVPVPKTDHDRRALFQFIAEKYGEDAAFSKFSINHNTLSSFFKEERAALPPEDQTFFRLPGVGEPTLHFGIAFRSDKGE